MEASPRQGSHTGARVLIADGDAASREGLRDDLISLGHRIAAEASDGDAAWRLARRLTPDLVILDTALPGADGFETASAIRAALDIPVLIRATSDDPALVVRALAAGSYGLIPKTCPLVALAAAIAMALERHREREALRMETEALREQIETRKRINHAKAILMKSHDISEPEAFERLRSQSQATGRPLREIADAVILASRTIATAVTRL
jgi:response regulator NasT